MANSIAAANRSDKTKPRKIDNYGFGCFAGEPAGVAAGATGTLAGGTIPTAASDGFNDGAGEAFGTTEAPTANAGLTTGAATGVFFNWRLNALSPVALCA